MFPTPTGNKIHLSAVSVIVGPIKDHLVYFMANVTPVSNGADCYACMATEYSTRIKIFFLL